MEHRLLRKHLFKTLIQMQEAVHILEKKKKKKEKLKNEQWKNEKHESDGTLKWAIPNNALSTEVQESNFQKRKSPFFTKGTSRRFSVGFGVCSDNFKNKKKKQEKRTKEKKKRQKVKTKSKTKEDWKTRTCEMFEDFQCFWLRTQNPLRIQGFVAVVVKKIDSPNFVF